MCYLSNLRPGQPVAQHGGRLRSRLRRICVLTAIFCASVLTGCASQDLPGVMEYQQVVALAKAEVANAVASLERVEAQSGKVPPGIAADFSSEVTRLEVNSIQIRARAQAIQARGEAYFKDWSENIARIKNPAIRDLAEKHHPELEESFSRIKAGSQRAGGSFKPFLSGLRTIRLQLETQSETAPNRDLLSNTLSQGRDVLQQLDGMSSELQGIVRMLTPAKPSKSP